MNFLYILLALFIFGLLIFIHELGHFIVARLCGVKVLEFAIGMGPKVISWKSKKSGTAYALRLLPIGGFVNMLGESGMELVQGDAEGASSENIEENAEKPAGENVLDTEELPRLTEEEAKHAYCNQSVWKRMLISIAGPAMNVILGFVLMFVMVTASGRTAIGTTEVANFHVVYNAEESFAGMQKGDYLIRLDDQSINSFASLKEMVAAKPNATFDILVDRWNEDGTDVITMLLEDVPLTVEILESSVISSLTEQSGLMIGDVITKVNGTSVHTAHELIYEISNQGIKPMNLTVLRDGEKLVLENIVVPNYSESGAQFGNMDFRIWPVAEEDFHIGTILKHTWFRSCSTVKMVFDSLSGLFSGRYGVEAVSGPVGITKTISDAAQTGLMNVVYLVVVISINLGVMNLLPLPALDGGHLLLYVIEAIRRKPLKKEVEGIINFIGLILLLTFAVIISIKDFITL